MESCQHHVTYGQNGKQNGRKTYEERANLFSDQLKKTEHSIFMAKRSTERPINPHFAVQPPKECQSNTTHHNTHNAYKCYWQIRFSIIKLCWPCDLHWMKCDYTVYKNRIVFDMLQAIHYYQIHLNFVNITKTWTLNFVWAPFTLNSLFF